MINRGHRVRGSTNSIINNKQREQGRIIETLFGVKKKKTLRKIEIGNTNV